MSGPPYHGRTHLPGGTDPLMLGMPWVAFDSDLAGATINTGDNYAIPITGTQVGPGGDPTDPSVFTDQDGNALIAANEPFQSVWIHQPGLYLCVCAVTWYQDWGSCHTFIRKAERGETPGVLGSSDIEAVALIGDLNLLPAFYIGFTGRSHAQIRPIHYRIYAVKNSPDRVKINQAVNNGGASNRTFTGTFGGSQGSAALTIIRLSATGGSNG